MFLPSTVCWALSGRKPLARGKLLEAVARANKLNKVSPYIEHQLCDLHLVYAI